MFEQILKSLFFISILFLAYVGGLFSAVYETSPYFKALEVRDYMEAVEKQKVIEAKGIHNLFFKTNHNKSGVTVNEKGSYGDYIFYSGSDFEAYLLNKKGEEIHKWRYPFVKAYGTNPSHVSYTPKEKFIYWRTAKLQTNGDVYAIYENVVQTPYGAGFIKIDKDSNLLWKYDASAHHDFDFGPDGKIYLLIHTIDRYDTLKGREVPFINDHLVVLSPDGKELKRISILNALKNSPFKNLINPNAKEVSDMMHNNNVDYITEEMAVNFKQGSPGQIVLSIRNMDIMAILDVNTRQITWAKRRNWRAAHDPDILANGNLLIFDNWGHKGAGGNSRIVEYDPNQDKYVWQYTGSKNDPFLSRSRGSQQLLPNGNILITESTAGRIFETNRQGKKFWEYYTPYRQGKNNELTGLVQWGTAYKQSELPFLEDIN